MSSSRFHCSPILKNISLDMEAEEDDEMLEVLRQKEESLTKSLERLFVRKETFEQKEEERESLEMDIQRLSEEVREEQEQAGIIDECMTIIGRDSFRLWTGAEYGGVQNDMGADRW